MNKRDHRRIKKDTQRYRLQVNNSVYSLGGKLNQGRKERKRKL